LVINAAALAERELAAFFRAVGELYGAEQAETSAKDWLHELAVSEDVPASAREWRTLTIAAAAQLASRVTRCYEEKAK
jgi:hypothetical protein